MNFEYQDTEWMKNARCNGYPDPDLWHYESSHMKDERELSAWRIAEAKLICGECPVKAQCLEMGLQEENLITYNLIDGSIWGGLMLGERLNIRDKVFTPTYRRELSLLRTVKKKMDIISQ